MAHGPGDVIRWDPIRLQVRAERVPQRIRADALLQDPRVPELLEVLVETGRFTRDDLAPTTGSRMFSQGLTERRLNAEKQPPDLLSGVRSRLRTENG
jgi:hypothetical protein